MDNTQPPRVHHKNHPVVFLKLNNPLQAKLVTIQLVHQKETLPNC